jgi:hypothetical protein
MKLKFGCILQVIRQGGFFGSVNITWIMFPALQASSLYFTNGTVSFADGQLTADLTIDIINDKRPSLDSLFYVTLVNVSQVTIAQ